MCSRSHNAFEVAASCLKKIVATLKQVPVPDRYATVNLFFLNERQIGSFTARFFFSPENTVSPPWPRFCGSDAFSSLKYIWKKSTIVKKLSCDSAGIPCKKFRKSKIFLENFSYFCILPNLAGKIEENCNKMQK